MDYEKIGSLICKLRKEKGLTQKQLGDKLHLSDKTISKWERGLGCPDISSLQSLADILGVNTEKILLGELNQKDLDGGNMKKLKFYMCPDCGNIIISTSNSEVSCCGRKLSALIVATKGQTAGLMGNEVFTPIVIMVVATTILTPIFLKFVFKNADPIPAESNEAPLADNIHERDAYERKMQALSLSESDKKE